MADQSLHVCRPPDGLVGDSWLCRGCWCTYLFRPVLVAELGRVMNLWVLWHRPPNTVVGQLRGRR